MYIERTQNIQITVEPHYVAENSRPQENYYFFSYSIRIQNLGAQTLQLVSRRWFIRDGLKRTHEVNGIGVVGVQPLLRSGEVFEYTSFCPLPTPTGSMRGSYSFIVENGEMLEAKIPVFFLRADHPSQPQRPTPSSPLLV